jgi:Protein of unknown function (DUF2863)
MNRSRSRSKPRLTRNSERLVTFALGLAASGSRMEDRYWDSRLVASLQELLDGHHDSVIDAALEQLFQTNISAYEELVDLVEGMAESIEIDSSDGPHHALLIAAPVIASSKYSVPVGPIDTELAQSLGTLIQSQVVASQARFAFAAHLFSIEHLPKKFSAMRELTRQLADAASKGHAPTISLAALPETPHMLADVRFLLAAIVAPRGMPHFRWQEVGTGAHVGRTQCSEQWVSHVLPALTTLLPGCQFECLLPDAYFASAREADRRVRPVSLRAAVAFLTAALNVAPTELRALIAAFGETHTDEYRIGFTEQDSMEVVHGVVWPLFGDDEEESGLTTIDTIETCLRACGVTKIERINERFAPEFCADCSAPLFADPTGDIVHAELPEDAEVSNSYLH